MADQVKENAKQEVEVADSSTPAAAQKKVELDLDDAPFLQVEEKKHPPSIEGALTPPPGDEKSRNKKRKLIIFGACAAGALVVAGAAVWWFFLRQPPVAEVAVKPDVIVVPSVAETEEKKDFTREFAPFIIPVENENGQTNFLVCKFTSISHDPEVNQEIQQHLLKLRDAIYFYLRSKNSGFLLDAQNGKAIKKDLISVFNDYLSHGQLEDILFESYLSR